MNDDLNDKEDLWVDGKLDDEMDDKEDVRVDDKLDDEMDDKVDWMRWIKCLGCGADARGKELEGRVPAVGQTNINGTPLRILSMPLSSSSSILQHHHHR